MTDATTPDFPALLRRRGIIAEPSPVQPRSGVPLPEGFQTAATTILAFKFAGGVLMAGDRRATAGNLVVYDRADKVLEIDRFSLMAIAGVPAAMRTSDEPVTVWLTGSSTESLE